MEPIYGVADGIDALNKYLKEQRKLGLLSKKTYDELLKRINQNSNAVDDNTTQLDKTSANVKKVDKIDYFRGIVRSMFDTDFYRTNRFRVYIFIIGDNIQQVEGLKFTWWRPCIIFIHIVLVAILKNANYSSY